MIGRRLLWTLVLVVSFVARAQACFGDEAQSSVPQLSLQYVAKNAVRVRVSTASLVDTLPDWIYVKHDEEAFPAIKAIVVGDEVFVKDKKGN